jgi:pyridoxal phosphate enzyme (YggS family)
MSVKDNLEKIRTLIPDNVTLVAVSKTKPIETLMEAYNAGQRVFGENKAQELIAKQPELPADVKWHFIGHLQTNKVKFLVPFVEMIESVDSLKLLKEIEKQAKKVGRKVNCLLQFHIAEESTKFGLDLNEAREILESDQFKKMQYIQICGVMGMATFTDDEALVQREFAHLKKIFHTLKSDYFSGLPQFKEISMGMSGDFLLAIAGGSTMVRIGSSIFGERN